MPSLQIVAGEKRIACKVLQRHLQKSAWPAKVLQIQSAAEQSLFSGGRREMYNMPQDD